MLTFSVKTNDFGFLFEFKLLKFTFKVVFNFNSLKDQNCLNPSLKVYELPLLVFSEINIVAN